MAEHIIKTLKFPENVHAKLQEDSLTLTGPKGTVTKKFKTYRVKMTQEGNKIILDGTVKNKQTDILVETIVSHIKNMAEGIVYGYKIELKVVYSHFPMSLQVEKGVVNIKNFLGEKFPRKAKVAGQTKVEIKGQDITISGINKDEVGQTASSLELITKVRGKDIRRYQDGIYIVANKNMEESKGPVVEVVRGRE